MKSAIHFSVLIVILLSVVSSKVIKRQTNGGFPFPTPNFNTFNFGAFNQPGGVGGVQNAPGQEQGQGQGQFNPFVAFHPSNLYNQAFNAFNNPNNYQQQGFGQPNQGGQQPVQGGQQGGQQPVQGGQQPFQGGQPNQGGQPIQGGQQPIQGQTGQQQGPIVTPNVDGPGDDLDQSQIDEIFQRPTESQ